MNKAVMPGAVLLVASLILAACGSSGSTSPKTVVRTEVKTSVATVTASDSAQAPSSGPTDAGATDITDAAIPTASGIVAPSRAGSTLSTSDFFSSDGWSDNVADIANQRGIQAVTSTVECGEETDLDLRLDDQFHTLRFSAGQVNTSADSDDSMTVTVTANGHQVTAKQVPFNTIQNFAVNVTSVNALQIAFADNDSNCNDSIDPAFFNGVLN